MCATSCNDTVGQNLSREDYVAVANALALSYCCDLRALHQLSFDHDCRITCMKHVEKQQHEAAAEEAVKRGMAVAGHARAYHSLEFACAALHPAPSLGQMSRKPE